MHFSTGVVPFLAVLVPLTSAQLNLWAKQAGLKYFGAATDTPGQRERAGFEDIYPEYDAIFGDPNMFGQTTPTNGMKWLFTEPTLGQFNYTEGEVVSSLAHKQDKYLRCHALVWHSQLAPWVEAQNWTKAELTDIITQHVNHVAGHWKGQCYAWDVVNEALNEDGTYRESLFYNTLGEDFIKLAFKLAAKADPDAKLYYNDYNLEYIGPKSEGARRIVKMLQDDGIRIDGIGMQSHLVAGSSPTLDDHIAVINSYGELNVEVALTELDVRIELPVNDTNLAWQKEDYKNAVGGCALADACIGITIWDFYDPFSWVPATFPGQGNPLLWFEDFTVHPAYYGALAALKNASGLCSPGCEPEKRWENLF